MAVGLFELPDGWTWAKLSDVAEIGSTQVQPKRLGEEPIQYVSLENVERGTGQLIDYTPTPTGEIASNKYTFTPEHVLYGKLRPYLQKALLPDFAGVSATDLLPLRPDPELLDRRFLWRWLLSYDVLDYVTARQTGVKMPRLRTGDLESMPVPVAPLDEQHRIVAKIDQLFAESRTAREALDKIAALIKRFRQSVLVKAFRGELTERDLNDEPAERLLRAAQDMNKTQKKRAGRLWGSGTVSALTDEERDSLPDGWVWAKVRDLGSDPDDTVQVGPMSMRSRDFVDSGVPVLNVGCVQWGRFDESKLDFLPESEAQQFGRYRIASGDILFTRSGTVGRSAVAQSHQNNWLMTFHLLRVRVSRERCLPEYLQLVFQGARHIQRQTRDASIGTTRAGFNTNLLAMLDVPLAPLAEQRRIVAQIEALFAQADAVERAVDIARRRAEKADQSILARAFRGEL